MAKVRAKFRCICITEETDFDQKTVTLAPVLDGSQENESFTRYTPSGELWMAVSNKTKASKIFEHGKEYFLDFIPVE